MDLSHFIVVGENIHCTRIVKRGGVMTTTLADGTEALAFQFGGTARALPVPADWGRVSPAYEEGKIKHMALAIWQSLNGSGDARQAGEDYLCYAAERQIARGATFLDVNVDEYSTDAAEQADIMTYAVGFLSARYATPLSIDSSNPNTLRAGLGKCRADIRPPMINSVSLERPEVAELIVEFNADAIVSAAGREGMPAGVDDRLANFRAIVARLDQAGVARPKMHLDPLVLPISTDPLNGSYLLEATAAARAEFAGVHLNGGLSNISFGMPCRKLLNMVFMYLCAERGTDGGIIDPVTMPVAAVAGLDTGAEDFALAKAVLVGEDMFGMEFIAAFREGRIKG